MGKIEREREKEKMKDRERDRQTDLDSLDEDTEKENTGKVQKEKHCNKIWERWKEEIVERKKWKEIEIERKGKHVLHLRERERQGNKRLKVRSMKRIGKGFVCLWCVCVCVRERERERER